MTISAVFFNYLPDLVPITMSCVPSGKANKD